MISQVRISSTTRFPSEDPDIVVEADESSSRPQRVMTNLTDSTELLPGSGVVQEIHPHDEVDRSRRLERRDVLMQIHTAQGMLSEAIMHETDHRLVARHRSIFFLQVLLRYRVAVFLSTASGPGTGRQASCIRPQESLCNRSP